MEPLLLSSMRRWHEDLLSKRWLGIINECEKCVRTANLLCAFNCSVVSDSFATAWTAACQTLLSMELSRQEYWSGLPFLPPEDLPDPGIKPVFSALAVDSLPLSQQGSLFIHISKTIIVKQGWFCGLFFPIRILDVVDRKEAEINALVLE